MVKAISIEHKSLVDGRRWKNRARGAVMASRMPATRWAGRIVEDDDVAAPEAWTKHLADIGVEGAAIHRPVEHPGDCGAA